MPPKNIHDGHRDRIRKRFLSADETHTVDEQFADHELLEILLFSAQPRMNTNETAHRLLNQFGSLRGVLEAPYAQLIHTKGIGPVSAMLIRLISAMSRAMVCSDLPKALDCRMTSLSALLPTIRRIYFAETATEHVHMLLFNADGTCKKSLRISDGTATGTSLDIPNCVRLAVQHDAASAVVVHNHPSCLLPSAEDIELTAQLKQTFDGVRITLYEHLIFHDNRCRIVGGLI